MELHIWNYSLLPNWGFTNTLGTIATRHCEQVDFDQLFCWKKLCQDSWWHTSVLSWISMADQTVTHFFLFYLFVSLLNPWEKLWNKSIFKVLYLATVNTFSPQYKKAQTKPRKSKSSILGQQWVAVMSKEGISSSVCWLWVSLCRCCYGD